MILSPRSFALLLAMTPGIGGKTVARVLVRNELLSRTPDEFLALSPEAWVEEYRLSRRAAANLAQNPKVRREETLRLEARLEGLGVRMTTTPDVSYPGRVESFLKDPPGVLFLYGNERLLEAPTFCVLSSRAAMPRQLELIEQRTEAGVLAGEVLVTGHDRPEYQRSAIVPLRWGSPRILCLDRGLFKVLGDDLRSEAFRAARLWRYEFDPKTDLVVSPFRPESDFVGVNNKVRDGLVAALSDRLDFVHVAPGGGMEGWVAAALAQRRRVSVPSDHPRASDWERLGASRLD